MDFLARYIKLGFPQNPEQEKLPTVIRVNTLKGDESGILKSFDKSFTFEKISFLSNAYKVKSTNSISSSKQYLLGQIYTQEVASQLASEILKPTEFETVLDMCAAPGSKTTHMAAIMQNKGRIVACDSKKERAQKLAYNLERCGVTNTQVYLMDARELKPKKEQFDKVLLDAPCSGNFMIDENWFAKRTIGGVLQNSAQQKDLLEHAIRLTKPGGYILYTTCSLEPEENEDVIAYILEIVPELKVVNIDKTIMPGAEGGLTEQTKGCMRMWPSLSGTQGFFYCLLQKPLIQK
jgi:tRNA (cytosine40_48-C5)-methyltransferase